MLFGVFCLYAFCLLSGCCGVGFVGCIYGSAHQYQIEIDLLNTSMDMAMGFLIHS